MNDAFNSEYPSTEHLREKARKRMPGFAFDYLDSGCNSEINLARNTADIRKVQLRPYYIGDYRGSSLQTELLRVTYDALCLLRTSWTAQSLTLTRSGSS
jgi:L-lactate dehydrogenase (cytochrome)